MSTPRSFHRSVELHFGSRSRPRRSPRINQQINITCGRPSTSATQSVQRFLFPQTEGAQPPVTVDGHPSSSEDFDRLELEGELSENDEFPRPPGPLMSPAPQICEGPTQAISSTLERTTKAPLTTDVAPTPSQGFSTDRGPLPRQTDEEPVFQPAVAAGEEIEKQNEFRRLYVHLQRINVNTQKSICSAFDVVQAGSKQMRGDRLFVVISGIMERTKRTALEVLEDKAKEKGKDFKKDYDTTMRLWRPKDDTRVVPLIADLEESTGVRQHPRPRPVDQTIDDESDEENGDNTAANHSGTGISLEEFTRLMIIFRDVPEAAEDLRRSGQDLSRADLDTGRTRDAFWTDRIEAIFNDSSFITSEKLDPPLQDIDSGRPVTEFRDGASLKDLFAKFRHEFTEIYSRWNVSGNMDHETFVNFCRLPRMRTLSRAGARSLIAFKIFRFGLPNQNTLLLDFCSKQIADGSGARLESGLVGDGESGVTNSRARKRLSEDAIHDDIRTIVRTLSAQEGTENPESKRRKAELEDLRLQRAQREADRYVMQQLMEAHEHRVKMKHPVDQRVNDIVDNYYKRLVDDAERRMRLSAEAGRS